MFFLRALAMSCALNAIHSKWFSSSVPLALKLRAFLLSLSVIYDASEARGLPLVATYQPGHQVARSPGREVVARSPVVAIWDKRLTWQPLVASESPVSRQ